jgi:hypothetical protein
MTHKDISEFTPGQKIRNMSDDFEVIKVNYTMIKMKNTAVSSTCKNLRTGKTCIVTWNKNCNFTLIE